MARLANPGSELKASLAPLKGAIMPVLLISAVLNILMLSGSFFMLLVYDEVLTSRSTPTLLGLILMVTVAYGFQGVLDLIRGRAMIHAGALIDTRLSDRIYDIISRYELRFGPMNQGMAPVRDLDSVRSYLSGGGVLALLDLPYVLLFLGILFIFHWTLGLLATFGVLILVALMLVTNHLTKEPTQQASSLAGVRYSFAETTRRNAEVIQALGMGGRNRDSWREISSSVLDTNDKLAGVAGKMQGASKAFRQLLQSLMLAMGAYLVILGEATGGVIIAGSILSARALMPVEQTIANWKGMMAARQAWDRLNGVLVNVPEEIPPMALPAPQSTLAVQNVFSGPPGSTKATVSNVSFQMQAGKSLAVVGHSGSGKSSLMRNLVGAWPIARGTIRLDGAEINQWDPHELGRHIGYVPQTIEMFDGTIAQNIARFDPDATPDAIIAAAKAADIHDLILRLPGGYEYPLGMGGGSLSAGQRQRVALARALYGDPFLIVLDEPNSNLDNEGEAALSRALDSARARGAIVIVVAHRPAILSQVDYIMLMGEGQVRQIGARDEMLERLKLLPERPAAPKAVTAG